MGVVSPFRARIIMYVYKIWLKFGKLEKMSYLCTLFMVKVQTRVPSEARKAIIWQAENKQIKT